MKNVMSTWTFGGVRLSSFGAVTELDSYLDLPTIRNENVLVPLVDGRIHAKKFYDQKTVTFGIEIAANNIHELEDTFDTLKKLLGSRDQQYLQYISSTGIRRAYAEVVGQIGPTRDTNPLNAKIVINFLLAEPFFRSITPYSNEVTFAGASPLAQTIDNVGTAEERAAIITFTGPLSSPKLLHVASGIYVQYGAAIAGGATVIIDCRNYTAVHSVSGNVINFVVHHGDPCFMVFLPGTNVMSVTDITHSTGKCKVEFFPPYL